MQDFSSMNAQLLEWCLIDLAKTIHESDIKNLMEIALKKALPARSSQASPPLFSYLLAQDLKLENHSWARQLSVACAYFYTAADLLDDIQDQDPRQPVLQKTSREQAMNITNLLLMACYQAALSTDLKADRQIELLRLFTNMGQIMSQGQYWDLDSSNRLKQFKQPEEIVKEKAGAEFACFFACVPCAAGLQIDDFFQLGQELGSLLQIFTDYYDIWLVPNQQALSQDLVTLKNSFPLYWARQDPQKGFEIDLALAGKNDLAAKQFDLRRLLVNTQTIAVFENFLNRSQEKTNQLFDNLPALAGIKEISETLYAQSFDLITGLKKLQAIVPTTSWQPNLKLAQAMQMAIDYLNFIPEYQDVWEVQRWGFLNQSPLFGDIFNPLLVLEALASVNQDIQKPLRHIIQKSSEDGWHYYSNTQLIPTDTDDLGQILQLAGYLPRSEIEPALQIPLRILLNNLESSGKCPTWLADEHIHRRSEIDKHWFGNECCVVMANLYYGLSCYDHVLYAPYIQAGVDYLIQLVQTTGWSGVHYPSRRYATYLVSRCIAQVYPQHVVFSSPADQMLEQQLLDGSWQQSPQETAFAVLFLALLTSKQIEPSVFVRAKAFLLDTQLFDGSWSGEDFFIRPGRENRFELFAHPKLTTTFCLRALNKINLILS